jgi:hypothetical protein
MGLMLGLINWILDSVWTKSDLKHELNGLDVISLT